MRKYKHKFKLGDIIRIKHAHSDLVYLANDQHAYFCPWRIVNTNYSSGLIVRVKRLEFPNESPRIYVGETTIEVKNIEYYKNALQRLKERYVTNRG